MVKRVKPKECADGSATLNVVIPRPIRLVAQEVGKALDVDEATAVRILISRLEGLFLSGEGIGALGYEWVSAAQRAKREHHGVIGPGPAIDITKLHRSDRTKSGFVGVYANGRGFRAMGKDPQTGAETYLGTFDTAIEAAWTRRRHYDAHGLPYGELEVEIAAWRRRGITGTDAELTRAILDHARQVGTLHHFTDAPAVADEPKPIGFEGGLPEGVKFPEGV